MPYTPQGPTPYVRGRELRAEGSEQQEVQPPQREVRGGRLETDSKVEDETVQQR